MLNRSQSRLQKRKPSQTPSTRPHQSPHSRRLGSNTINSKSTSTHSHNPVHNSKRTLSTTTACSLPPQTQPLASSKSLKGGKKRVVVGISGGVDSATTAALLIHQGYDVIPIYMTNWDASDENNECTAEEDLFQARKVAQHLGLDLHEVNFSKEYWANIFETVLKGYSNGITPNPDILCNKHIKFGVFYDHAMKLFKPDFVATGHYARISFSNLQKSRLEHDKAIGQDVVDALSIGKGRNDNNNNNNHNPNDKVVSSILSQFKTIFQSDPHDIIPSKNTQKQQTNTHNSPMMTQTLNPALQALFSDPSFISTLPQFRTYDPLKNNNELITDEYMNMDLSEAFLTTSVDSIKDQTYFLSAIEPSKLPHILFPIGHYPKKLTRSLASIVDLPNSERKDSMGVCFVGQKGDFGDFLAQYLSDEQQYPGTMMSIEQFIELMYIYSVDQNGNDGNDGNNDQYGDDEMVNENDEYDIPITPKHKHRLHHLQTLINPNQNHSTDTSRSSLSVTYNPIPGLEVIEENNPISIVPSQTPLKRLRNKNSPDDTITYSIHPNAQELARFEEENDPVYWKNNLQQGEEQYEKRLKSMTYHKNVPKGEEDLIPYPPQTLSVKFHESGVVMDENSREVNNIDRVIVPFNQQHQLKMDKATRGVIADVIQSENKLHDNIQIKYNSTRFIPHFQQNALDLVQFMLTNINDTIGINELDDKTRGEMDELIGAVRKAQTFDPLTHIIQKPTNTNYNNTDSSNQDDPLIPSVPQESLGLIAAIPILQQIGHFVEQFKEYEMMEQNLQKKKVQNLDNNSDEVSASANSFTSTMSRLPAFYQHSLLDFTPHKSLQTEHHIKQLDENTTQSNNNQNANNTPKQSKNNNTKPQPTFEMHDLKQFLKISLPIWLKVINLILKTPYHQTIDDATIKAIRTTLNNTLKDEHNITISTPHHIQQKSSQSSQQQHQPPKQSEQQQNQQEQEPPSNNKKDNDGDNKDEKGEKQSRQHKKQGQNHVQRPQQSIYHQQIYTLLKLLPSSLIIGAGSNYTNRVAHRGVLETYTEFDTQLMGHDDNNNNRNQISTQQNNDDFKNISGFYSFDYETNGSIENNSINHNKRDIKSPKHRNDEKNSFSLAKFYPKRFQWFRSPHSTPLLNQDYSNSDRLSYNPLTAAQIDQEYVSRSEEVPDLGSKLSTLNNLGQLSVFKQLNSIHYKVQMNVHELINYRTRIALFKNSAFKRHTDKPSSTKGHPSQKSQSKNDKHSPSSFNHHTQSDQVNQVHLDVSARSFSAQWKRAFQSRGRLSEIFPSSYRFFGTDEHQQGFVDTRDNTLFKNGLFNKSSQHKVRNTITSSSLTPIQSLLTRTVADSVLHHKLYKLRFGQYHNGLIRYTENQRLGALGARETVLMKIPVSNTLLYTTGHNHPFSLKDSCVLTDFTPLSTNPFHLMQVPTQYNDLSSGQLCDEVVERLFNYSNDLYSRSMKSMGDWVIANQNRLGDDVRVVMDAKRKAENNLKNGNATAAMNTPTHSTTNTNGVSKSNKDNDTKDGNNKGGDATNGKEKGNTSTPPPTSQLEEDYAPRIGPPPIIMNNNNAIFRSYRALFPFSDFGFVTSQRHQQQQHRTTPLSNALSSLFGKNTSKNNRNNNNNNFTNTGDGDVIKNTNSGYKAYAKIRSTGALLPCRLILEDIPLKTYIYHSIQKMNQNNIGSFYQNEEAAVKKMSGEKDEVGQLYNLLDQIDQKITAVLPSHAISPLSRPLFHQKAGGINVFNQHNGFELLNMNSLTRSDIGKLRTKVYQRIRELETNIHLHHPTTAVNHYGDVINVNPTVVNHSNENGPSKYKRVLRVIFDHQQEFLSNGQTIAIYIPSESTISNDLEINKMINDRKNVAIANANEDNNNMIKSMDDIVNNIVNPNYSTQFPTLLESDLEYESALYQTMGKFDLKEEFAELKDEKIHPAFIHDSSQTSRDSSLSKNYNRENLPQPLSQPNQLLDGITLNTNQSQQSRSEPTDPFAQYFDTQRNTTLPTAFDRFICLGSGTIVL